LLDCAVICLELFERRSFGDARSLISVKSRVTDFCDRAREILGEQGIRLNPQPRPVRSHDILFPQGLKRGGVDIGFGDEENTVGSMERAIAVAAHTIMLSPAADNAESS
jgi:hypothetical protein